MRKNSLRQLYVDELKDLYSAETQMVKALAKAGESVIEPRVASGV